MTDQTCRCGKPTRDAAYCCDDCTQTLAVALGEIPWLEEQLDITISRQKGVDYRRVGGGKGGKKATERPLPAEWGASEARTHLKAILVSWALCAAQEGIRNQSPTQELPADTLSALSRYLLWRVDGFALTDLGPEIVDEITSAVAHCHRLVDRPAERQYLGACGACDGGRLYARPGSDMARCDACRAQVEADAIRKRLLDELDDRLCTAAEIAHLSTWLGLKADREQVRKHVEYLARKGRIVRHAAYSEQATYRFGEVYEHLVNREYGRAS